MENPSSSPPDTSGASPAAPESSSSTQPPHAEDGTVGSQREQLLLPTRPPRPRHLAQSVWPIVLPTALFCFLIFGFNPVLSQFVNQVGLGRHNAAAGSPDHSAPPCGDGGSMCDAIGLRAVWGATAGVRPSGQLGLRQRAGEQGGRAHQHLLSRDRGAATVCPG